MLITPTEQKIYRHFYRKGIFSLEECIKFLNSNYRATLVATKNLVSKKYILKIRRGLYYVIPYSQTNNWFKGFEPNQFIIASCLVKDAFISHNTALEFHGLTDKPISQVYLCSKQKIPDVKLGELNFYIIKTKYYFGFNEDLYKNVIVKVSDIERTIVDCLRNINFTSGLEHLLDLFS